MIGGFPSKHSKVLGAVWCPNIHVKYCLIRRKFACLSVDPVELMVLVNIHWVHSRLDAVDCTILACSSDIESQLIHCPNRKPAMVVARRNAELIWCVLIKYSRASLHFESFILLLFSFVKCLYFPTFHPVTPSKTFLTSYRPKEKYQLVPVKRHCIEIRQVAAPHL